MISHAYGLLLGDKNGSIRAWSTSLNSFPMVTQFLGKVNSVKKHVVFSLALTDNVMFCLHLYHYLDMAFAITKTISIML